MPSVAQQQVDTKSYIAYRGFTTMNTQSAREALAVNELSWCENMQIVGPNQLVVCNGPAPSIFNIAGTTFDSLFFANFTNPNTLVNADHIIAFGADGSGWDFNLTANTSVKFALAGTFSLVPDCTTWSSQRVLIADATAGYCTWDGNVFVQSGGASPHIVVTAGGGSFGAAPGVTLSAGSGGGAVAATAHSVITGGVVTAVVLDTAGTGYLAGDTITVTFSPATGAPAATAIVWPHFSLTATTLAIFAGRVWIGGGRVLTWTGTKGFDDAATADAAGSTTITDADLVHSITALRSLNNFLYIFGDNSIKQIGTVTVSGSTTIFNIVTLSSDQGTPFPRGIASYNRLILFANKVGVYAVLGASVEKVSDPMDGIFALMDFSQPLQAAVQDLHTSLHTFLLLARYKDPVKGITRSIMLSFYKNKWFLASQGDAITSIVTCPINGIIETFSSSGSDITQMFQDPTKPVTILVQTALSDNGAPHQGKRAMRCSVSLNSNTLSTMNMTVDTENGSTAFPFQTGGLVTWVNNLNQKVQFQNNSLQDVFWFSTGFLYQRSKAAGTGVYLGLTLEGSFSGLIINGMVMEYQDGTTMASRTAA
jgi:hypothetical protein